MMLNKFKTETKESLMAMTENQVHELNWLEAVERYLIIEGYTDHQICGKIEMTDMRAVGADSYELTIVSTYKRHRKPSYYHKFMFDGWHKTMKVTEFGNL